MISDELLKKNQELLSELDKIQEAKSKLSPRDLSILNKRKVTKYELDEVLNNE